MAIQTVTQVFKSVAKLKTDARAVADTLLYVSEPGREGYWYYDSSDTSTVENTGTVLVSGVNRYKRKLDTDLSVKKSWFTGTSEYFESTADIIATIAQGYRIRGMRFKVFEAGITREYWYKDGTSDTDLVQINVTIDAQTYLNDALSNIWDYKSGNHKKIVLTTNATSAISIINMPNNSEGILHFIQGAGGNKTLEFPGLPPTGLQFSTQEGERDLIRFIKDGDGQIVWSITNFGAVSTLPTNPGTVVPLSFTEIPYANDDIISPFRGAYSWHNAGDKINYPNDATTPAPMDEYRRTGIEWFRLEPTQGNYAFNTVLAPLINACISANPRRRITFNVMCIYGGASGAPTDGGTPYAYPTYLHALMQAKAVKDFRTNNGYWIPNYNDTDFLSRTEALLTAMNTYFNTTSYNGVLYADVIGGMDIGIVGEYGEWHHGSTPISTFPAGVFGTATSFNRIIQAHITAFPNVPLNMNMHTLDARYLSNVMMPPETAYFALNASNTWGKLGIARMNYGRAAMDPYINDTLLNNTRGINGMNFGYEISERWKYAPMFGEGPNYDTSSQCGGTPFCNLMNEVLAYHTSGMGNGNFSDTPANASTIPAARANLRAAFKRMGYRIILEGGSMTENLSAGGQFQISLNWKNIGIAPVYENWNVQFILKNGATTVWTGNSSHVLRLWLPQSTATVVTDTFTLPSSIANGTYTMALRITDPRNNYRAPFILAINGRQSDGSYTLRSVEVGTGGGTPTTPSNLIVFVGDDVANRGLNSDAAGAEIGTRSMIKILNNTTLTLQDLNIGVNNQIEQSIPSTEHGIELGLAIEANSSNITNPSYLVKSTYSYSAIAEWLNGGSPTSADYGWSKLTARVNAAVSALNTAGTPYTMTVVLAIGSKDTNTGTTSSDFQSRLSQFRADFRALYGSTIKFIVYRLPSGNSLNTAITNFASADANTSVIDTTAFTIGTGLNDAAHLSYTGLKTTTVTIGGLI